MNSLARISVLSGLFLSMTFSLVSAGGPSDSVNDPVLGLIPPTGMFSQYFQNLVNTDCPVGYGIIGFSGATGLGYATPECAFIDGIWKFNGTNIYYNSGSVGIGTTTPGALFDVRGDAWINGLTFGRGGGGNIGNTVSGYQTLGVNTTGDGNNANGYQTLYSNTIGSYNIAQGYRSLYANIGGSNNIAQGSWSLGSNTYGSYNVANGDNSLYFNTVGNSNTAQGYQALFYTSGSGNIGIGYRAGSGISIGNNNIAIGYNAQVPTSTGSNQLNIGNWIFGSGGNIGIGPWALVPTQRLVVNESLAVTAPSNMQYFLMGNQDSAGANQPSMIGASNGALYFGTGNTWIGKGGTFSYNVAFTSNGRVGIGVGASPTAMLDLGGTLRVRGSSPYTGAALIASDSLGNAIWGTARQVCTGTGTANTCYGQNALSSNTAGANNTAIGFNALTANTIGFDNVAIGADVLRNNTGGTVNVAIGKGTMTNNRTGNNNIALGRYALNANVSGSQNLALGTDSLNLTTTSSNNIALGVYALNLLTTGNNNIAIGVGAQVGSSTGSNQLSIGNWIYGNSGMIGLGISSPQTQLEVRGTGTYTTLRLSSTNSAYSTDFINAIDAGNAFRIRQNGFDILHTTGDGYNAITLGHAGTINTILPGMRVGIGTTTPRLRLDVNGDMMISNIRAGNGTGGLTSNVIFGVNSLTGNTSGTSNSAFGYSALVGNTTGYYNTAFGRSALENNTIGYENTAIGGNTLQNNISGYYNIALGTNTLNSNTTGYGNIGLGYETLRNNTLGNRNIALGYGSMYSNLDGYSNIAQGTYSLYYNTSGYDNIAFGHQAMYYNTGGSSNISLGYRSLFNNATGTENISIGKESLLNNTVGISNTAIGSYALYFNTGGSRNVAIGENALNANRVGIYNTAVGVSALQNNIASENVAVGYQSLYANSTGTYNTAVGVRSMNQNTIGSNNTAYGYESLRYNTGGVNNTAIGRMALRKNTSGYSNVALGLNSLLNNTTGNENVALGQESLVNNISGLRNTAIGHNSLYTNTTGDHNIAAGPGSLFYNTSGYYNVAIGTNALFENQTGYSNIAVGPASMQKNTSGYFNLALGLNSSYSNSSGIQNNIVGYESMFHSLTGSNNTTFGFRSGYGFTAGNGNIAIGSNALSRGYGASYTNLNATPTTSTRLMVTPAIPAFTPGDIVYVSFSASTIPGLNNNALHKVINSNTIEIMPEYGTSYTVSGSGVISYIAKVQGSNANLRTIIGTNAGDTFAGGDNTILIGANTDATDDTTPNQLNIGNWIYGSGGNIGIGAQNPTQKLAVTDSLAITNASGIQYLLMGNRDSAGTNKPAIIRAGNGIIEFGTGNSWVGQGGTFSSSVFFLDNGRVGIGVPTPLAGTAGPKLEIGGQVKITGGSPGSGKVLTSDATGLASWQNSTGGWGLMGNAGTSPASNFIGTTDNRDLVFKRNNIEAMRLNSVSGASLSIVNDILVNGITVGRGSSDDNANSENTVLGYESLMINTSGQGNTAIGQSALWWNNGDSNTAVGRETLYNNASGYENTAIGDRALFSNTIGTSNTAIGPYSMHTLFGSANVAVGGSTLQTSVGSHNTALGINALNMNNGDSNTAIGSMAMLYNYSGSSNIGIGGLALSHGTGSYNIGIGESALSSGSGSYNIGIGYRALMPNTGRYNIAIGHNAQVPSATGSNQLSIGNSIYGSGVGTAGVQLGINTQSPTATLDLNGQMRIRGGNPTGSGKILRSDANGLAYWTYNIPGFDLINGNVSEYIQSETEYAHAGRFSIRRGSTSKFNSPFPFSITLDETLNTSDLFANPNYNAYGNNVQMYIGSYAKPATSTIAIGSDSASATGTAMYISRPSNGSGSFRLGLGSSTTEYFSLLQSNGYVGIGTTNPTEQLEVAGNVVSSGALDISIIRNLRGNGDICIGNTCPPSPYDIQ